MPASSALFAIALPTFLAASMFADEASITSFCRVLALASVTPFTSSISCA